MPNRINHEPLILSESKVGGGMMVLGLLGLLGLFGFFGFLFALWILISSWYVTRIAPAVA